MIVLWCIIAFFIGAEIESQLNKRSKNYSDRNAKYVWKKDDGREVVFRQIKRYVELNNADPISGQNEVVELTIESE